MSCQRVKECTALRALQLYPREIREGTLLTVEEEQGLVEAIACGDREARSRLIRAHLWLVLKIAHIYVGRGLELDDLVGEGSVGLIRAAERFDPSFGTRFSTYATYWIKQAIRQALTDTTWTIRLPAHMVRLLTNWRRAERGLREKGCTPTFDEVASSLGVGEAQKVLVAHGLQARRVKLESNLGTYSSLLWPEVSSDGDSAPEASLEANDGWESVRRRLGCLSAREYVVVALRYGLGVQKPLTLREIGQGLGMTKEGVRRIEVRALRKLAGVGDTNQPHQPSKVRHQRGTSLRTSTWVSSCVIEPPAPSIPPTL
jgi:RNA polymerase primary sigma factor